MNRKAISWRVRGKVMALAWHRPWNGFLCHWCMSPLSESEVVIDHLMPLALGGTDDVDNLVVACQRCNSVKGAMHPDDAEDFINAMLDREAAE